MAEKMRLCCGRKHAQITSEKNRLRILARRAATQEAQNRSAARTIEEIGRARDQIQRFQEQLIEHEAQHAGEGE